MMKRRDFLLASGVLMSLPSAMWAADSRTFSPILSACRLNKGAFRVGRWDTDQWTATADIGHRGHDSCVHRQRGELLFFSRRPGREILVLDANSGTLKQLVIASEGYHYYGHGCLSADGRFLYTTENHVTGDGRGAIGIYDCANNYALVDHFDCGGVGPHQIALMPDGDTLVVAVGGIKTLPAQGRKTLNFDTMAPALHYLDRVSGTLLEQVASPHPHLSLRHLDVAGDGSVVVGGQFQAELPAPLPLVYRHRRGGDLQPLDVGDAPLTLDSSYVASISIDDQQSYAVSTCPRDDTVCLWHLPSATLARSYRLRDCAGVVYDPRYQQFILSNGGGQLMALRPDSPSLVTLNYAAGVHWDNHLRLA